MRGACLWFAVLAACGGGDAKPDAPVTPIDMGPDADPLKPLTLAGTGLCANPECTQYAPGVFEYAPRFELWSDGATKKRWIYLPPGTQIDTSDMDYWKFPLGTKLWKEFTRDGTRVETRYIVKTLADDNEFGAWHYVSYQWNDAQNDTTLVDVGGVENANGTMHDIPTRMNCRECHEEMRSRVLGFGAIQLDVLDNTRLDLEDLIAMGKLTVNPTGGTPGNRFQLPGPGTVQNALGYMHANCGGCHNPTAMNLNDTMAHMRLTVGSLGTVATTAPYMTMVDKTSTLGYVHDDLTSYTLIIDGGDANNSILTKRMQSTNVMKHMPKLGSEVVDPTGFATLTTWIDSLP